MFNTCNLYNNNKKKNTICEQPHIVLCWMRKLWKLYIQEITRLSITFMF